ncbi:MAG: hypothetical protein WD598_11110 [Acidimicrobiia bacterium]
MKRWGRSVLPVLAVLVMALGAACRPAPPKPPPPAPLSSPPRTGDQNASLGSCPVFPADNAWNTDISAAPLHPNSANYLSQIGADGGDFLHADFGGGGAYGIPYVTVAGTEPTVPVTFVDWPGESDPGPYPVPLGAPVEGGSDRHVISIDRDNCKLYEMYNAWPRSNRWDASNGAKWDLNSNALRPNTWTSADAAGLPIFAGLARYDEVAAGEIDHALRVTFNATQRGFIYPATHFASSSTNPNRPPMGLRLRLAASYDISGYTGQARVILEALKKYGLINADNGSNWFITGAADSRWNDNDLNQLKNVPGAAFEVVDTGPIRTS